MKKNFFSYILLAIILFPLTLFAQKQRSQQFKDNYTLKGVVILSRHNIRAPLSTKGSLLETITSHEWNHWSAGASQLTSRGGVLETINGIYFHCLDNRYYANFFLIYS